MPVHRSIPRKLRKKARAAACRENYKKRTNREKKEKAKETRPQH